MYSPRTGLVSKTEEQKKKKYLSAKEKNNRKKESTKENIASKSKNRPSS